MERPIYRGIFVFEYTKNFFGDLRGIKCEKKYDNLWQIRAELESLIRGHSLRVGGAQSLAAGGASIVEMQTAGRWRATGDAGPLCTGQLAARGAVARVRYGRG